MPLGFVCTHISIYISCLGRAPVPRGCVCCLPLPVSTDEPRAVYMYTRQTPERCPHGWHAPRFALKPCARAACPCTNRHQEASAEGQRAACRGFLMCVSSRRAAELFRRLATPRWRSERCRQCALRRTASAVQVPNHPQRRKYKGGGGVLGPGHLVVPCPLAADVAIASADVASNAATGRAVNAPGCSSGGGWVGGP